MSNPLIILALLAAVGWLLLVRPQKRRQQQTEEMLASLRVGMEVVSAGGIYGRVSAIEDDDVWLEIAPELTVRLARRAVAGVITAADEPEDDADADEEPVVELEEPSAEAEPAPSERG